MPVNWGVVPVIVGTFGEVELMASDTRPFFMRGTKTYFRVLVAKKQYR
jgi:hypothetical protein